MQGNPSDRPSAVRSGVLTGISTAAVSGSAAAAGALLSRRFGHGVETDGFFAAYGVYLVVVLVASALRVVVLPRFARARELGGLGVELGSWLGVLALAVLPLLVVALVEPHWLASALTGSAAAERNAAALLPWLVPAAAAQLFAGVCASALAAFDDYGIAAFSYAAGALAGLAVILGFSGSGVAVFGWGLAVNGGISLGIPLAVLLSRRALARPAGSIAGRLRALGEGVALPAALQGLYLIAYRFASGLGAGRPTTFSYAYLISSLLVAVTATSIALVSSVPLARAGLTPGRAARHVVSASWVSLALVAGAAGVFALAGERVVRIVLGSSYGGQTGSELGRLVAYLAPWMVVSVAVSVAFPLLFVRGSVRWLPLIALAALGLQTLFAWTGSAALGLAGIAAAMAVTTALVLAVLLAELGGVAAGSRGIATAALALGACALLCFGAPGLLLGPLPAAAVGLVLYVALLAAWRPAGLRAAWSYLHELE